MFPRHEGQAPEDLITGVVSSCEGSPRAGCRKTCWRGAKLTEILAMGYSTYWLALGCRCSSCRRNGRFLRTWRAVSREEGRTLGSIRSAGGNARAGGVRRHVFWAPVMVIYGWR